MQPANSINLKRQKRKAENGGAIYNICGSPPDTDTSRNIYTLFNCSHSQGEIATSGKQENFTCY